MGRLKMDYFFPPMHSDEVDGVRWRVVTEVVVRRANNSPAVSFESASFDERAEIESAFYEKKRIVERTPIMHPDGSWFDGVKGTMRIGENGISRSYGCER